MNKMLLLLLSLSAGQLAAQCISLNDCPTAPPTFSDLQVNNPLLWNESYWLDPITGLHDLAEMPVGLSLTATINCTGQTLAFRYLLFLDMDGDGIRETVVDSDSLPGFNNINFNNAANPNFTGGTPSLFDERPVGSNQKYGFAKQEVVNGSTTTASVKWNTQVAPGTYVDAQLPLGNHKIKWIVTTSQGEEKVCEYHFVVVDGKRPTVVCKNGLSVNILPNQQIQLFGADFLQYMEDNVTPTGLLTIGIRKSGTGTDFPLDAAGNPINSVIYTCAELGTQLIELWSIDLAGNADFCETYIIVQDNLNACPPVSAGQPEATSFQVAVAPNPFAGDLQMMIRSQYATRLSLRLTNQMGQETLHASEVVGAGEQRLNLPTETLPAGVYFLWVEDGQGVRRVEKVVKQ